MRRAAMDAALMYDRSFPERLSDAARARLAGHGGDNGAGADGSRGGAGAMAGGNGVGAAADGRRDDNADGGGTDINSDRDASSTVYAPSGWKLPPNHDRLLYDRFAQRCRQRAGAQGDIATKQDIGVAL